MVNSENEYTCDVLVVGGGVAGICAAIGAARCGVKTALVHDRALLGGNASGELRVHIAGADIFIDCTARPGQWPNLWMSQPIGADAEWLRLSWPEAQSLSEVHLAFDGQFDSNLTWPAPLGVFGCEVLPSLAKRYDIQVKQGDEWITVAEAEDNYRQRPVHTFDPVTTDSLRIRFHATNGVPEARVFEVRAY